MTVKVHKEVQIFKRICSHDEFEDHVEEVHFPQPVCVTGVKLGAVPEQLGSEESALVHIFAHDLITLGAAKFACLAENCALPETGTKAIRLEATITDHIVFRGRYQTLPIAVYGRTYACKASRAADSPKNLSLSILPKGMSPGPTKEPEGITPQQQLSPAAIEALRLALPYYYEVLTSEKAMRQKPLDSKIMPALLSAADQTIDGSVPGSADVKVEVKQEAGTETEPLDLSTAVTLAAGWCRCLAAVPRFGSTLEYGMSGLASAVILSATPKTAIAFLKAGGVPALSAILESRELTPAVVRYTLAALEGLTMACPAAACEAILGWWRPNSDQPIAEDAFNDDEAGDEEEEEEDEEDPNAFYGDEKDVENGGQFWHNGQLAIPQHGDGADEEDDPSENDRWSNRAMTPAILDSDEERAREPHGSSRENRSSSKKERKEKKEKKDRKEKSKDKDKDKDRGKERSRDPKDKHTRTQSPVSPAVAKAKKRHQTPEKSDSPAPSKPEIPAKAEKRQRTPIKAGPPAAPPPDPAGSEKAAPSKEEPPAAAAAEDRGEKRGSVDDVDDRHTKKSRWESRAETQPPSPAAARRKTGRDDHRDEPQGQDRDKDRKSDSRKDSGDVDKKDRSRDRDRDRDKERSRDRDRDREREKDRGRDWDRNYDRDRDRSRGRDERDRDRDKDRRRYDDSDRRGDRDRGRNRRHSSPPPSSARLSHPRESRYSDRRGREEQRIHDRARMPPPDVNIGRASARSRSTHRSRSPPRDVSRDDSSRPSRDADRPDRSDRSEREAVGVNRIEEEAKAEQEAAKEEASTFQGCYASILSTLTHLQPHKIVKMGERLMARLQVYQAAAKFQVAAENALRGFTEGVEIPLQQTHKSCSETRAALDHLATALHKCCSRSAPDGRKSRIDCSNELQLGGQSDLDPWVMSALQARRCLPLVATVLHVPNLQALQHQSSAHAPGQNPAHIQAQLLQLLLGGVGRLLSLLTSCPGGFDLLNQNLPSVLGIIEALNPRSSHEPYCMDSRMSSRSSAGTVAVNLKGTIAAYQAFSQLQSYKPKKMFADIKSELIAHDSVVETVQALAESTSTDSGRRVVLTALSGHPEALESLLAIMQSPVLKVDAISLSGDSGSASIWKPASIFAIRLVAMLVADSDPSLIAFWASRAHRLKEAVSATLNLPDVQQPGGDKAKKDLKVIRGRAEMALLLKEKQVGELLGTLDTLLPRLERPDGQAKGYKIVKPKACIALLMNHEKAASAEACLQILHCLLLDNEKSDSNLLLAHQQTLEVLERAVRCGTECLIASQSDSDWISLAGDAIDTADILVNRSRTGQFLAAGVMVMRQMLQRMQQGGTNLNSATLMRTLLMAHAVLIAAPESFSALAGNMANDAFHPILQARQATAASLKCWVDAELWTPDLVTAIFTGGKPLPADGPLVVALNPRESVCAASLLGDLFPSEWPPTGGTGRLGGMYTPPSQMAYRRSIATNFESSAVVFRRLITTAALSESRMFRAMLVRLCARAAGLGGGMGVFLAGPLMETLNGCVNSGGKNAQVILEILVPLVYRPALKAAFLELGIAPALAKLILLIMNGNPESSQSTALCTMVLEIVTVLFNYDISLNPMLPVPQRVIDDTPSLQEAAALVVVLLTTFTQMAGNAHISKRIFAGLKSHSRGCQILSIATKKWQSQSSGYSMHDSAPNASIQWAIARLWQLGQEESNEAGMRGICMEVAGLLEEVAAAGEEIEDEPPEAAPAAQRFAQGVQASLAAAESLGAPIDDQRSELSMDHSPEALINDPATKMFWRNVKARFAGQLDAVNPDVSMPIDGDLPTDVLPEGLTKPKRQRDVVPASFTGLLSAVGKQEAISGLVKEDVKTIPTPLHSSTDPPPVMAGPGRPKSRPFGRGGSSGRPASMHVDDYEKAQGARPAPVPPPKPPAGSPLAVSADLPVPPPKPPPGRPLAADSDAKVKQKIVPKYPPKKIRPFGAPKPVEEITASPAAPLAAILENPSMPAVSPVNVEASAPAIAPAEALPPPPAQPPAASPSANLGGTSNIMELLKSPAAVAELIKDPVRLQELLEKNPALMSVLQAKMKGT